MYIIYFGVKVLKGDCPPKVLHLVTLFALVCLTDIIHPDKVSIVLIEEYKML